MLGQEWAKIHFVENAGMAFGIEMGGTLGKYALSLFRILMVGLLGYILYGLVKNKESRWLIFCFSLILAGAIGNIIDSAVYGLIFSESGFHKVAEFMPDGGGYAPFLQGKVVDMFSFSFFSPVFNIADSAISVGVVAILLFHRSFFTKKEPGQVVVTSEPATATVQSEEE